MQSPFTQEDRAQWLQALVEKASVMHGSLSIYPSILNISLPCTSSSQSFVSPPPLSSPSIHTDFLYIYKHITLCGIKRGALQLMYTVLYRRRHGRVQTVIYVCNPSDAKNVSIIPNPHDWFLISANRLPASTFCCWSCASDVCTVRGELSTQTENKNAKK